MLDDREDSQASKSLQVDDDDDDDDDDDGNK
jgi:hypothetical protein